MFPACSWFVGAALKVEKFWNKLRTDSHVASWQSGRCLGYLEICVVH